MNDERAVSVTVDEQEENRSLKGNLFLFLTSTVGLTVTVLLLSLVAVPASIIAGLAARLIWWGLTFGWELL